MRYCKIENGVITKYNQSRKDFGVGVNSDEQTCIDKGYYPLIDDAPNPTSVQRINGSTYEIDEATKTVTKVYTVVDKTVSELMNEKNQLVMTAIDNHIQAEIVAYNEANGVAFVDVNAVAKYVTVTTYTHNAFCVSMVNWVASVWDYVRGVQAEIIAGTRTEPSLDELMLELPARV